MSSCCRSNSIFFLSVFTDCFEFVVNEKVVYSKNLLKVNPDTEELLNIALQLNKVQLVPNWYLLLQYNISK